MSRIGKKPVGLTEGLLPTINEGVVRLRGQKGELELAVPAGIAVSHVDNTLVVKRQGADSATFGRIRSQLANMVKGVSEGWEKTLEIIGTGYRASTDGKTLTLALGFSHPVVIIAPEGITFSTAANKIIVSGLDKALVGLMAAKIRSFRRPDVYKGKGIRYAGEVLIKKQGKAAKGATGAAAG